MPTLAGLLQLHFHNFFMTTDYFSDITHFRCGGFSTRDLPATKNANNAEATESLLSVTVMWTHQRRQVCDVESWHDETLRVSPGEQQHVCLMVAFTVESCSCPTTTRNAMTDSIYRSPDNVGGPPAPENCQSLPSDFPSQW